VKNKRMRMRMRMRTRMRITITITITITIRSEMRILSQSTRKRRPQFAALALSNARVGPSRFS